MLLVEKTPLPMSRQGLECLKEIQGEEREEGMVVLLLAPVPLMFSLGMNQVCWSSSTFFHSACSNSSIRHGVPRLIQKRELSFLL